MLWGNRNAFYYVLDRVTGEFLHATAFAKQTWAEKIDHTGRPVRIPDTFPTKDGTLVYPDVGGAANWWSPTYSPKTELFYLMAFDGAGTYYLGAEVDHKPGLPFLGGFGTTNEFEEFPDSEYVSAVRALDPTTGNRKWEYRVQAKSTSGLVSYLAPTKPIFSSPDSAEVARKKDSLHLKVIDQPSDPVKGKIFWHP